MSYIRCLPASAEVLMGSLVQCFVILIVWGLTSSLTDVHSSQYHQRSGVELVGIFTCQLAGCLEHSESSHAPERASSKNSEEHAYLLSCWSSPCIPFVHPKRTISRGDTGYGLMIAMPFPGPARYGRTESRSSALGTKSLTNPVDPNITKHFPTYVLNPLHVSEGSSHPLRQNGVGG